MASLGTWYSGNQLLIVGKGIATPRLKVELLSQNASTNTSVIRYTSAVYWEGTSWAVLDNLYDTCAGVVLYNSTIQMTFTGNGLFYCITRDRTITHDANGNASFTATHQWGSGSVSANYTLPQISRRATITSVNNFVVELESPTLYFSNPAGYWLNLEFFVWNGANWEPRIFSHQLGQAQFLTVEFIQAQINAIYAQLGGATTGSGLFRLRTYSDAGYTNQVGNYHDVGVTLYVNVTLTEAYITNTPNFTIGNNVTLQIHNPARYWLRLIVFLWDGVDFEPRIATLDIGQASSYTTAFTQAQIDAMYAQFKNMTSGGGLFRIHTYSDAGYTNQVGNPRNKDVTVNINTSINTPTFVSYDLVSDDKAITVKDSYNNELATTTTNTLTGSNQKVISGVSQVKASITSANKMVAKNQADPVKYRLVNGDKLVEASYKASETVNLLIDNITSKDAVVSAYDSRGLATAVTKSFSNIANYTPPTAWNLAFVRDNNVDAKTKLSIGGKFWKQYFGGGSSGVQNTITAHYRYKETTASWGSQTWNTLAVTSNADGDISFNNYINGDLGVNGFNKDKSYSIEVRLYDKISALIVSGVLSKGTPLLDWTVDGVAIKSKYDPVKGGSLQVDGENIASGWFAVSDTLTFNSTDNPTGVINWSGANNKVSVGMRFKFENGGHLIYGIVTAVTSSTMTFLHEMNNNLAVHLMVNSAITSPCISTHKAPLGFPVNPDRWSVFFVNNSQFYRLAGVSSWGLLAEGLNLVVPIGGWDLEYSANPYAEKGSGAVEIYVTLSTSTSSVSDQRFTCNIIGAFPLVSSSVGYKRFVSLSAKTTYCILTKSDGTSVGILGNYAPTTIRATCHYL